MLMNAFMSGASVAVRPAPIGFTGFTGSTGSTGSTGFLEATGIDVTAGRWFTETELRSGALVAVVSERVAARAFPGQPAVGQQIKGFVRGQAAMFDVIGVVRDARMTSWDADTIGQVYGPYSVVRDSGQPSISVIARSDRPDRVLRDLLALARQPSSDVRIERASIGADILNETVRARRLNSWLFGAFALAALVIVGVGILGLMAMNAARRTREIGIRMALGSTPARVVRLLISEEMMAVAVGLIAGGLISAWAVQFVRSYLYHVAGTDARLWAGAVAIIVTVALIGAAIPAWRASRINPSRALRAD
jgi:hypothetical protein